MSRLEARGLTKSYGRGDTRVEALREVGLVDIAGLDVGEDCPGGFERLIPGPDRPDVAEL